MQRQPGIPYRYIGAVVSAALVALGVCLAHFAAPDRGDLLLASQIVVLTALARRFPLHVSAKTKLTLDAGPVVVAVLLLPAPLAVLSVAGGKFVGELLAGGRRAQVLFNSACTVLRMSAGVVVWSGLTASGAASTGSVQALTALAAALLVMVLLAVALVEGVIALSMRRNPLRGLWSRHRLGAGAEVGLALAGFAVTCTAFVPVLLPLLLAPVLAVHLARQRVAPALAGAART